VNKLTADMLEELSKNWPASLATVTAVITDVDLSVRVETLLTMAEVLKSAGEKNASALVLALAKEGLKQVRERLAKVKS
jgi:uracil phosphoribosyltransferase